MTHETSDQRYVGVICYYLDISITHCGINTRWMDRVMGRVVDRLRQEIICHAQLCL